MILNKLKIVIQTNLGIFSRMKELLSAPRPASTNVIIWGNTPSISAIYGAKIVTTLAAVLPYPKTVAVKIVGINSMKEIKIMLNAAEIPNLATPTNMEIYKSFLLSNTKISPMAPATDTRKTKNIPLRAPSL
mgnify:CR=1 FL=1